MKLLTLFITGIALISILNTSCSLFDNAEAQVTIINWGQVANVNVSGDTLYSEAQITYKIENIGTLDIGTYEVYFRVETINGKTYEGAGTGGDLKVGEIDFNNVSVATDSTKAEIVENTGQFVELN